MPASITKRVGPRRIVPSKKLLHVISVVTFSPYRDYDTDALADGVSRMSSKRSEASFNVVRVLMTHQPGSIWLRLCDKRGEEGAA